MGCLRHTALTKRNCQRKIRETSLSDVLGLLEIFRCQKKFKIMEAQEVHDEDYDVFSISHSPSIKSRRTLVQLVLSGNRFDPSNMLKKSASQTKLQHSESFSGDESAHNKPPLHRNNSMSVIRPLDTHKHHSTSWEWPLGGVNVQDTDTNFKVTFGYKPFASKEVSVKIVGRDMMIVCSAMTGSDNSNECGREFSRVYKLPLNTALDSVKFDNDAEHQTLTISALKLKPVFVT